MVRMPAVVLVDGWLGDFAQVEVPTTRLSQHHGNACDGFSTVGQVQPVRRPSQLHGDARSEFWCPVLGRFEARAQNMLSRLRFRRLGKHGFVANSGEGTPVQAAGKVPVHWDRKYRWEVTGLDSLVLMWPRADSYRQSIAIRGIKVMP